MQCSLERSFRIRRNPTKHETYPFPLQTSSSHPRATVGTPPPPPPPCAQALKLGLDSSPHRLHKKGMLMPSCPSLGLPNQKPAILATNPSTGPIRGPIRRPTMALNSIEAHIHPPRVHKQGGEQTIPLKKGSEDHHHAKDDHMASARLGRSTEFQHPPSIPPVIHQGLPRPLPPPRIPRPLPRMPLPRPLPPSFTLPGFCFGVSSIKSWSRLRLSGNM